jgi:hypothetical protein
MHQLEGGGRFYHPAVNGARFATCPVHLHSSCLTRALVHVIDIQVGGEMLPPILY